MKQIINVAEVVLQNNKGESSDFASGNDATRLLLSNFLYGLGGDGKVCVFSSAGGVRVSLRITKEGVLQIELP